jgi:putative membrane protein
MNMKKLFFFAVPVSLVFLLSMSANAAQANTGQNPNSSMQRGTGNIGTNDQAGASNTSPNATASSSDQTFAKAATSGGMAEVKLGELAQQKGSSQAVKDFGKRMADDHQQNDAQLQSALSQANINVPMQIDAKDQATYNRLSKLSGSAFDRAYAQQMVRDHTNDLNEFKHEAANGKNPALKNYATQTVPKLQEHLDMARQLEQQASNNRGSTSGSIVAPVESSGKVHAFSPFFHF